MVRVDFRFPNLRNSLNPCTGDGFVSIRDICSVLSIIAKGTYEDKLKCNTTSSITASSTYTPLFISVLFQMYDSDGTGVLTAAEIEALLHFIAERIVHWTGADSV
jgi:hypothetical protein